MNMIIVFIYISIPDIVNVCKEDNGIRKSTCNQIILPVHKI